VVITNATGGPVTPGTWEQGDAWRAIRKVPTPGVLPAGWQDGYYADAAGVHIMTLHLSYFALLRDVDPPTPPQHFAGTIDSSGLTLSWDPGTDNSGLLDHFTLFVNGTRYANYGLSQHAANLGAFDGNDTRRFTLAETDGAGNESAQTKALRGVPALNGLTQDQAKAALLARGFAVGSVQLTSSSTVPRGIVIGGAVQLAEEGSSVDILVSVGTSQAPLSFLVSAPKSFSPAKAKSLKARVTLSRAAKLTITLLRGKKQVKTWKRSVAAGNSTLKLAMPGRLRAGTYSIRWVARADSETKQKTTALRVAALPKRRGASVAPGAQSGPSKPSSSLPRPPAAASARPVVPVPAPAPGSASKPTPQAVAPVAPTVAPAAAPAPRPAHHAVSTPSIVATHAVPRAPHRISTAPHAVVAYVEASRSDRTVGILLGLAAVLLLAAFFLSLGQDPQPSRARAFRPQRRPA